MSDHMLHEYKIFSVRTYITYENKICLNLCYTRKYDVRTYVTYKMCNV